MKTKKQTAVRVADPELISQLEQAIGSIHTAQSQFEQVVDPMLIDCYIYELNAAQLRYQFLLKSIKKQEQLVP
ncbi:MAG: YaaL family protein [Clostridiaceae bacterium]|nr:YaaL family protein [Clostridiaceae bacterium]